VTPAQTRALRFVADHPGGTARRAFFGYAWSFDAPELKRAPFRTSTLSALLDLGMIGIRWERRDFGWADVGDVVVTKRGLKALGGGQ
jgi:hypothetical protein